MSEPSIPVSVPASSDLELRKNEAIRKLAAHLPDQDDADFIRLKKLAIVEKLLASFDDPNMSPFHLNEIESFHSHPPLRPAPAYLNDVDLRLQLLRDIKATELKFRDSSIPPRCLPADVITPIVWAAFITAPIEALQVLLNNIRNGRVSYHELTQALELVNDKLPAAIPTRKHRNRPGCDMTDPQVGHILGHVDISNASKYYNKLGCLATIWGEARIRRYQTQPGENVLGGPQNTVSFKCVSHQRWDKTHVAFEPIDKPDDRTIRLRLHLLQDTKLMCPPWSDRGKPFQRREAFQWRNDLATDPRRVLDPFVDDRFVTEGSLEIQVGSSVTQHIVRDGYVFEMTSEDPALLPNYDVLDLQYRIELMRALIGAGKGSDDVVSRSATEWEDDLSVASGYSHEDF
ncbi:hypothetical protein CH35J_009245 [Colletotrichum higginsianum]|uniref:HNH nuclease domain-containing protein n=1 Tax=Colletotrichum higginsianum TaxID=80884 RepID=A0A4T0VNX7_9PEZI|nr:hypothetical protein CH35J_009245 [Colletotrichum higginsianum]